MATIFSKIIAGEIPCFKIYEDEHVLAFLDIRPMSKGHTLIVPKIEVDHYIDVPEPYYTAVFQASKIIGQAMMKSLDCERVANLTEGFEIPHCHLHVIPMYRRGDLDIKERLSIHDDEMEEIQQKIIANISL